MMEYAPGGELFVRLAECGSYTEHEAKPIFAQIASAVQYMVISLDIDYNIYRPEYSQVPIKRVEPNKRVGWIFYVNFIKKWAK